jgi:hypothetical protein
MLFAQNKNMKTIVTANWRPLLRALSALLLSIAALGVSSSARGQIYVSQIANNTVGEYDASTGAAINASLITGTATAGLALSGKDLFVPHQLVGAIGDYDPSTGAAINANLITGLASPYENAVVAVPEPSTWSMIAIGAVSLLGMMRRKKTIV